VWATSWGVSTRLVGGRVMAHGDDDGLILPPRIAPLQVGIVPIYKGEERKDLLQAKGRELASTLKAAGISVKFDENDNTRPGFKFAEYELKGVPVRIAMGLRDLDNRQVEIARRDTREKTAVSIDGLADHIVRLLEDIQQSMYKKALAYRDAHITDANTWDEFMRILDEKGGFVRAHWDGTAATEDEIKEKSKATIRCIPLDNQPEEGTCILSGRPSHQRVLFARAY
jgi:prolyl-tRNA synthetase